MAQAKKKAAAAATAAPKKVATYHFSRLKKHATANPNDRCAAEAVSRGAQPGKNRKPTTPGLTRVVKTTNEKGFTEVQVFSANQIRLSSKVKKALAHERLYGTKEGTKSLVDLMNPADRTLEPIFKRMFATK